MSYLPFLCTVCTVKNIRGITTIDASKITKIASEFSFPIKERKFAKPTVNLRTFVVSRVLCRKITKKKSLLHFTNLVRIITQAQVNSEYLRITKYRKVRKITERL